MKSTLSFMLIVFGLTISVSSIQAQPVERTKPTVIVTQRFAEPNPKLKISNTLWVSKTTANKPQEAASTLALCNLDKEKVTPTTTAWKCTPR